MVGILFFGEEGRLAGNVFGAIHGNINDLAFYSAFLFGRT